MPGEDGEATMELSLVQDGGVRFVEGPPDLPLMSEAADIDRVLEACFSAGTRAGRVSRPS
jgi:hypothetical protein